MQLDISILEEIDSPVKLDQKKSKKLFFFEYDDKETSISEVMKSYIEEKENNQSNNTPPNVFQRFRKKSNKEKLTNIVTLILGVICFAIYSLIAISTFLSALSKDLRQNSLKDGYEWFPAYENAYILLSFIISFSIIFLILIALIAITRTVQISSKDYSLDCLQYRQVDDYTEEDTTGICRKSKGFYFKAIDLDWDLLQLFAFDISGILFLISAFLFIESLSIRSITIKLNSIANNSAEKWELFNALYLFTLSFLGILALIFVFYLLISKTYNYTKIKNEVYEIIESKLFLIDAFVSKPSTTKGLSELEHLRFLQLQNKLYHTRDNLRHLPSVPITNWNLIVYSFAGLSALFSFLSIFLDQLLKLLFVTV